MAASSAAPDREIRGVQEPTALIGASDCEALGTGWLVQPVNALSGLACLRVGGWWPGRGA